MGKGYVFLAICSIFYASIFAPAAMAQNKRKTADIKALGKALEEARLQVEANTVKEIGRQEPETQRDLQMIRRLRDEEKRGAIAQESVAPKPGISVDVNPDLKKPEAKLNYTFQLQSKGK